MIGSTGTPDNNFQISVTPGQSPIPQIQSAYSGLEKGYGSAINGQSTVPQLTAKYNDQYGVPQLQGQVQNDQAKSDNLNTQINMAPKTIAQASQESILTQGQKDAAVQNLTTPLQQELATATTDQSRAQTNLGTAQTNAGQQVAAEQAQQTKQLLPFTQAFTDENVISAMQETGFTTQEAQELSVLLANQQAGQTWTNAQADRANQLALSEQGFEQSLKLQKQKEANTYTAITPTDVGLYNQNGQVTSGSAWA